MNWREKYHYKTWWGALIGHTATMILSLAFISFLTVAAEGTLIAVAATSFWWSVRAKKHPLRSGMLPSIVASLVLQCGYFYSGREMYPLNIMMTMIILNIGIVAVISLIGSSIGKWIRNRKIKKEKAEEEEREQNKSNFSQRLKTLAIITLFFYVQMFVVVPLAAKVSAAPETSDEFIQNYDPAKTYTVHDEEEVGPAKRHVPLDSPYANVSGTELEKLEAFCKANGCSLITVGGKLSQLRQSGTVSLSSYLAELSQEYAPKPPVQTWQNQMVIPGMLKDLKEKLTEKNTKAKVKQKTKPDTRPWWQKGMSMVKGVYNAYRRFDQSLGKALIHEPINNAWQFAKKHPWQAAGIAALAIGATVTSVVWAPAAIVVGAAAVVAAGVSAYGLAKAYHDDGWNGVKNNVFSKQTQSMWNSGDRAGAAGRGTAELISKAIELVPLVETPAVAAKSVQLAKALPTAVRGAVEGIPATVTFIKTIPEMRVGISVVVDKGILNEGAVKVVKAMAKVAGEHGDALKAVNPFIQTLPENQVAIAALNADGKAVTNVGKIVGTNENVLAEKKAGEMVKNVMKENFTALSAERQNELKNTIWKSNQKPTKKTIPINPSYIPSSSGMAAIEGSLPKPGSKIEVTEQQLEQIERLNPNAHGIDEHVAKTNAELESQKASPAVGGRGKREASSYANKKTYVKQVNKMLNENSKEIENWLRNPNSSRIELKSSNQNEYLGRILDNKGNPYTRIGKDSVFVLDKNTNGKGYHIVTNYVTD